MESTCKQRNERAYLGFGEHEEYGEKNNAEPHTVDNVILPSQVLESNWVDELVEETGSLDRSHEKSNALGANVERKDLYWVRDSQGVPADVVGRGEEDDTRENTSASSL